MVGSLDVLSSIIFIVIFNFILFEFSGCLPSIKNKDSKNKERFLYLYFISVIVIAFLLLLFSWPVYSIVLLLFLFEFMNFLYYKVKHNFSNKQINFIKQNIFGGSGNRYSDVFTKNFDAEDVKAAQDIVIELYNNKSPIIACLKNKNKEGDLFFMAIDAIKQEIAIMKKRA